MPFYCYKCGIIGHRLRDCLLYLLEEYDSDSDNLPYPKSLEVQFERRRRISDGINSNGGDRHSSEAESGAGYRGRQTAKSTPSSKPYFGERTEDNGKTVGEDLGDNVEFQNSKMGGADGVNEVDYGLETINSPAIGLKEGLLIDRVTDSVIEVLPVFKKSDVLEKDSGVGPTHEKGKGVWSTWTWSKRKID